MSRRRGSRLFSGHPGLILVSEDIPGITMPAPPADLPPLEDEEPDFDLMSFRQEEDEEEAAESHDGPLRVFLGSEQAPTPVVAEVEETPVFDVSALAMPSGPDDGFDDDPLRFMDDSDDFDASDVVDLDGASPPALSMGVSAAVNLDDAAAWDDSPTQPGPTDSAARSTAVIRDTPPVVQATSGDPVELPDAPFSIDDPAASVLAAEDEATAMEPGAPADVVWDEDDTGFFDVQTPTAPPSGLPSEPPKLSLDTQGKSRTFRAIPDKEDPPILPLLLILIGIVVMTLALLVSMASKEDVANAPPPPPAPVTVAPAIEPAPRTEGPGQVSEVTPDMGFISIDSDKPANVYVGDQMVGITPIVKSQVRPGSHRIMAIEIETGKRKAVTAEVERGAERRVRFAFQPVQ